MMPAGEHRRTGPPGPGGAGGGLEQAPNPAKTLDDHTTTSDTESSGPVRQRGAVADAAHPRRHIHGADRRESTLRHPPLADDSRDWRHPDDGHLIADTRYHRPSTGLRASGFAEGWERCAKDTCSRLWPHLSPEGQALACMIAREGDREAEPAVDWVARGRQRIEEMRSR